MRHLCVGFNLAWMNIKKIFHLMAKGSSEGLSLRAINPFLKPTVFLRSKVQINIKFLLILQPFRLDLDWNGIIAVKSFLNGQIILAM